MKQAENFVINKTCAPHIKHLYFHTAPRVPSLRQRKPHPPCLPTARRRISHPLGSRVQISAEIPHNGLKQSSYTTELLFTSRCVYIVTDGNLYFNRLKEAVVVVAKWEIKRTGR